MFDSLFLMVGGNISSGLPGMFHTDWVACFTRNPGMFRPDFPLFVILRVFVFNVKESEQSREPFTITWTVLTRQLSVLSDPLRVLCVKTLVSDLTIQGMLLIP